MPPQTPSLSALLSRALSRLEKEQIVARIWRKDHTVWKPDPTELANRLGWLDVADRILADAEELESFVADAQTAGFSDAVVLGMGGSSLAPEVFRRSFRPRRGFLRLHVLDSTVPGWVAALTRRLDLARTLFVVSSKSGGTIEVMSFFKHFWNLVVQEHGAHAGEHFVAVTDAGTSLQALAAERGFRRVFANDPNIGGRYSVQSYFGMLPAALMGLDVRQMLGRVQLMMGTCAPANSLNANAGATLGAALGAMALAKRDKLALIISPSIASFGLWAEQLVAESTGKEGKGILPIALEPPAPPKAYGADRLFAYVRLSGDDNAATDRHAAALERSGHLVLRTDLDDRYALASEFFRWEFATAVAGALLGIQPFDQPNVQESKDNTAAVLATVRESGQMPDTGSTGDLRALLQSGRKGDYVALMAYLVESPALSAALQELRARILRRRALPVTLGYGPRFLHSTGQYHKGGPNTGLFVQLTADWGADLPVPGEPYSFGQLAAAQCVGDYQALIAHGRRVVRVHLGRSAVRGIRALTATL